MMINKSVYLFIWIFIFYTSATFAQNNVAISNPDEKVEIGIQDTLSWSIAFLKMIFNSKGEWVSMKDINNKKPEIWPANTEFNPVRIYLKNSYNDSLSVMLYSDGKGNFKFVVDDGVKFTRLDKLSERNIIFKSDTSKKVLQKIVVKKQEKPAWNFHGDGTVGFTQTALSNWAKGGDNSMFLLIVQKLNLNYYKKKWKWENNADIRYGVDYSQNNGKSKKEDKFEFQSRLGFEASKKWYYSAETNFKTQMGKGYNYPDKENTISAFLAPAYRTFSFGFDYKPNPDFSLFLSPLTFKSIIVRGNSSIDPTNYGLNPGTTRYRDMGVMVKTNWKTKLFEIVDYETKVEYFNIYGHFFQKYYFQWEQLFVIHLSRRFSTRINTQVIYDFNTKFPVLDSEGNEIGKEPKWQFKEFFTLGFNYRF